MIEDFKKLARIWAKDVLNDGHHEYRLAKVFAEVAAKARLEAFYFFKEREAYHNAFRNCFEDSRIEAFRNDIEAERERLEKEIGHD